MRFVPLFAFLVSCLLSSCTSPQKLDKITDFKLVYWRAFHPSIEQTIKFPPDGGLALSTETKGATAQAKPTNDNFTITMLPLNGLDEALMFFNDPKARDYFATTKVKRQSDGSWLEIAVTQNSYSLRFSSQDAFAKDGPPIAKEFGRLALKLIGKSGMTIPEKERY